MFRLVFIFVGAELLQVFFWTAYLFGAFLIWTGYKMAVSKDEEVHPDRNIVVRLVKRMIPTDPTFHGGRVLHEDPRCAERVPATSAAACGPSGGVPAGGPPPAPSARPSSGPGHCR
ncbi:TerC family membrane protein [Streptomyces griseoflavus Tu4000]|uniref:TerC family membrane protein n=1 Tax=Streptomyces griseoflavus Tu4000 TaxID=467200 RepID=D9XL96_9ACTN|nr:TerC family membrane protein [Streptomyces griseoflavus Tu4000]